ncbi:DNA primase [Mucilaginibacter rubeus]|uniref:DNA primase n=1 Tax=Mucilaginibacter rubeus TaxID=2027860 RepID=A0AAE6JL84_9SPHI|nr:MULTISPECIES: DNA primase [Mucilaginibacter]QEM07736.1 DNA primase [Mucilaginibacter rubeus]QEM20188.1 DNA primase [Mucilaginibacter gossypii]QTE43098.1 DNA primase [Mucilaginibacter rubeus]QTE49698.1 DNA primase [Mucilaginibacter rubeus]QTE54792.1 DNA primase [Mucilaginibacter rubeus]
MIQKSTIDRIMEATDIVEVIGEFVQLKKRGANYVGLSPFANERTPSFTVSPAKGIFKDFSTGKGGSAVTFLMELEKFSYPEALKWLAKKYGIEVEETVEAPENREEDLRRESLMIVSAFAAKFFHEAMLETEEGQSIGLSYFKERGFTAETIKKFELGYSPDQWEAFTGAAIRNGYKEQFLVESGLSVKRDNGALFDRYRGRVMFPIHSFTGRVIGFGGRTLKKDKNVAKYVNSPESEIYHKSNVLYGLYFAKKAIREQDNCYLVEGYADVLSVHQTGVENVVASSGTSLTTEQIKLIARFTKNITILYDGDAAGIKASLRGLDMILEEGLNVKVVLFPDGHDPDSFVQSKGSSAFKKHIEENKKDFILYKTQILLKEVGNDPIRKADVIREVVESIAKIPDNIKASVFIKECSGLLQIDERALLSELNKMRTAKAKKEEQQRQQQNNRFAEMPDEPHFFDEPVELEPQVAKEDAFQEKEIVRLLLHYGSRMIDWDGIANTYIGPFIIAELSDVTFDHPVCKQITEIYRREVENGVLPDEAYFIHHKDKAIVDLTINMLASKYSLSENWYEMHKITVNDEQVNMKATILGAIFHLKKHKVGKMLEDLRTQLQKADTEADQEILLNQYMRMKKVEKSISDFLGSVIIK